MAPLRDGVEPTDVDGAYRIQSINTQHWVQSGRRIVGRKIGLTAESVQKQLGVDQPDFGTLFADMQIPNGARLDPGRVIQAKAEAEVALVMGHAIVSPTASMHEVMAACAYAVAAIEIVDSRIADWKITLADTIADNASSAFFVLGEQPISLLGLDLRTCGMVLEVNGKIASMGTGAACLGHPLNAAAWLARTLAALEEPLQAGDIVLTGALGPMVPLRNQDAVRASIGGLGTVSFTFASAPS